MSTNRYPMIIVAVVACLSIASTGYAKKLTVYLESSKLTSYEHTNSERGSYYTIQIPVPAEIKGKELHGVILEFYLDATGAARSETSVKVPVIEVYALNNSFTGNLASADVDVKTGSILNVPPGDGRRLRVDITKIVREYIKDPAQNYGLIVGGLAEYREGAFELKSTTYKGLHPAKIDYHYDARTTE